MLFSNKTFLIIPLLILIVSCNKVNNRQPPGCGEPEPDPTTCSSWQPAIGISAISGPATATVGQYVSVSLTATARNGCAQQAQVTSSATGNNINFGANVFYSGCICTEALVEMPLTYTYHATQAGTFTFTATGYEGNPVTYTLTVQ